MLISVIVPIYNGEKYLKDAIESVLGQPYKDIEVICVNDGSTDNSNTIVENIMKCDNRVRLIKQKNQGVAVARNCGIENSKGTFIAFLDQDDLWVKNTITEKFILKVQKEDCDIVSFGYYEGNQELTRGRVIEKETGIVSGGVSAIASNFRHHSSYWYKKQFLIENEIKVDGYRHEDERFRVQCLYFAKNIMGVSKLLFLYRNNSLSVTHQKSNEIQEVYESCINGYIYLIRLRGENDGLVKYANDMIIALLIELLEKKSSEKYGVQKFNEIVKENGFENYFDLKNHWLDDHKKRYIINIETIQDN